MTTETVVKSHPILFSGPMVSAILDGSKTQTRRVVKVPSWAEGRDIEVDEYGMACVFDHSQKTHAWIRCPFAEFHIEWGRPIGCGYSTDHLWVRESWRVGGPYSDVRLSDYHDPEEEFCDHIHFRAEEPEVGDGNWRPSIHMPRWASRITLEVTEVRVERLHDITEEDARAEGLSERRWESAGRTMFASAQCEFRKLWDEINAGRGFGWDTNPWVWCVTFKRINP